MKSLSTIDFSAICLSTAIGFSSCLPVCAQNSPTKSKTKTSSDTPSKIRLYGQVNELLSACANAGVEISSTTLPARIQKVRLGSPAYYGGLQDNDIILKGNLDNNRLKLTIRRGPSLYALDLATAAGAGPAATALKSDAAAVTLSSGTQTASAEAQATTKDPAWKKLRNYDIVMLIDQSGSMSDPVDANGTTKWDWCSNQLTSFASQALDNTGRRFTIITFNGEYTLKSNCSPSEVQQTFLRNRPGGPTDLATPLHFVLSDYINGVRKNPLLVVVLTDGEPARPDFIIEEIVAVTKKMSSPEQIKIVFFEIGNDTDGAALIRYLDVGLGSDGARYDIVDANNFARLQQVGLKAALYDTFNANFQTSLRFSPTGNLQSELEAVRKQLKEARERSALNGPTR